MAQILSEYQRVVEPVAACLDLLQGGAGEETAAPYMGCLLPALHHIRTSLERTPLIYCPQLLHHAQPLVEALLRAYEQRFGHLYHDVGLLMATALHPHFTPAVLDEVAPEWKDSVKQRIIRDSVLMS